MEATIEEGNPLAKVQQRYSAMTFVLAQLAINNGGKFSITVDIDKVEECESSWFLNKEPDSPLLNLTVEIIKK